MVSQSTTTWNVLSLIRWTTEYFQSRHIDSSRITAEVLLAHVMGIKRIDLYLRFDQPVSETERNRYKALIRRRTAGEPTAYITGVREFWSRDFRVDNRVLIPRPETEGLVEAALEAIPPDIGPRPRRILEMGTGSGAVIITLSLERPGHSYTATDRSEKALTVAAGNARLHHVDDRIGFVRGDWFSPLDPEKDRFDFIISNPPYVAEKEINQLQKEIGFEPGIALNGGQTGLSAIRKIVSSAPEYLRKNGRLFLEFGYGQAADLIEIVGHCGRYHPPVIRKDPAGHERIMLLKQK